MLCLLNCYFLTARLPARNLEFSEVTSNSFKVTWSPAGENVLFYLIKYKEALGGEEVSVSVRAPVTNTILTNLLPKTTYSVSVIAEYEDGDGPPLDGNETTLEGIIPIASILFFSFNPNIEIQMFVTKLRWLLLNKTSS